MLQQFKRLTGDTALYGMSSILGRLINFILVPIHTRFMSDTEYGINSDIYTILAFLMVLLTYGFETGFFRFAEKYRDRKLLVYSTATRSILISTLIFLGVVYLFQSPILETIRYADHPEYLWMLLGVISADAISAVPMAKLRNERRAKRFVRNRLLVISINVLLNVFFFMWLPEMSTWDGQIGEWCNQLWNPQWKVTYVLLANLIANVVMLIDLLPEFLKIKEGFDKAIWKEMLRYSIPLMLAGLPGVANEMADRQFIKYLMPEEISLAQLGIYSAVYKLSIALVLFNQAFRYAAEPLFFEEGEKGTNREVFAQILRAFTVVMCFGLVVVLAFSDILKEMFLQNEEFWVGMDILPILLISNVFLGIHTNMSIWYKLSDKTKYGIYITGIGFFFTVVLNLLLIPRIGIMGAAYATLASYASMATASYILGQIHYPIPYPVKTILFYLFISSGLGYLAFQTRSSGLLIPIACIIAFTLIVAWTEKAMIRKLVDRLKAR